MAAMAAITINQQFDSLAAFKKALSLWAINTHFQPKVLDSDSKRVRVGCRSGPACPFRVRCNYNEESGKAKVTTLDSEHRNHIAESALTNARISRPEASKLRFLVEALPQLMTVTPETKTKEIIDLVSAKYGTVMMLRQAQKVKAALLRKQKRNKCRRCGQEGHNKRNCPQRLESQHLSGPIQDDAEGDLESSAGSNSSDEDDEDDERSGQRRGQEQHCRVCHNSGHNARRCPQREGQGTGNVDPAIEAQPHPPPQIPSPFTIPPNPSPLNTRRSRPRNPNPPQPVPTVLVPENPQYRYPPSPLAPLSHTPNTRRPTPQTPSSTINNLTTNNATGIFHTHHLPTSDSERLPRHLPVASTPQPPISAPLVPVPVPPNIAAAREAARLMQEAARLTQEAARLHQQAANLIASSILG